MDERLPSRRAVLRAGGAALGSAALAGCFGDGATDGSASFSRSSQLGVVPADAGIVLAADLDALLADEALRTAMNDRLAATADDYGGPPSMEAGLNGVRQSIGLDLRDVSTVVGFGGYGSDPPGGVVLWTDWTTEEVREVMTGERRELATDEYRDRTVLDPAGGPAVAAFEDGRVAVAERRHLESVIDLAAGEADPVGGTLRDAFEETSGGAIRLAFGSPEHLGGSGDSGATDPTTVAFGSMTHGHGAYVIDGDDRRASLTVETDSTEGASAIREQLETRRSRELEALRDYDGRSRPYADEWVRLYEDAEIARDGTTVAVTVDEAAPTVPILLVPFLPHFPRELIGRDEPEHVRPEATFTFEYDPEGGLVTATHYGGDAVRADLLSVRGEGFASASGADMVSPGPWAGETSGTSDGQPAIVAGDSVTVGVEPDYRLRLAWESADGSAGTLLGSDRGPEA